MVINAKKIKQLVFFILIPIVPSFIISSFTNSSGTFDNIEKPFLTPPSFVFPIAWTILYVLMGISSYLIYTSPTASNKDKKIALTLYLVQLIFNFLWTPIFFNLNLYFLSFIWIVILIILVILMIFSFYKVSKPAAFLQIPYLIWLVFAGYLSYSIYLLN